MAKIAIPDEYQLGILKLLALDDAAISSIKQALINEADGIPTHELASIVSPEIAGTSEKDIFAVLRSLRALYIVRSNTEAPIQEFVADLANAVNELRNGKATAQQLQIFRRNVASLMAIDPFAVQVKARDLQTEDERTFCRARILTDIRPVFGDEIEDGLKGMVIMHHLKLGFHQTGATHTDFHISMDSEDLDTLKTAIERAEAKAKKITESFPEMRHLGI